jgi:peptidoglycan/LPS O-acetylase OafA/YrhL
MEENTTHLKTNPYVKFASIMAVSFVVMYLVMFLNVAEFSHVHNSLTRFYMTTLMIAAMAINMLLFMWKMYPNRKTNLAIIVFAATTFFGTLFLLRTQTFIGDIQYMKAMIPHHSSAIMTSSNVDFKDPEAKKLAEDIIAAQEREIKQMNEMIIRLESKK